MQKPYYELNNVKNLNSKDMEDIVGGIIVVCRQSLVDIHDAMKRVLFNAANNETTTPDYLKGIIAAGANFLS